jgi:predicted aspartyl protease
MYRSLLAIAAAAVLVFSTPATAQTSSLSTAIEASDIGALTSLGAGRGREAALARGVLAALHRQDEAAIRALRASARSRSLTPELRAAAWQTLSGVYLRQSRFADAAAAMSAAAAFGIEEDAATTAANTQARIFAEALADAPRMRAEVAASGETAITRDLAQLARAQTAINGVAIDAVLDTGASYSTIAQSVAERMGLRFLDAHVTVGSATGDADARLAIADTLTLAGGVFHDVVFIVLPDEALTFAGGAYKIEAIVGFPVLVEFGRLEFASSDGHEHMRHRRSSGDGQSNMILDGLQPIAQIEVPSANATLVMIIDTGARKTGFSMQAARDFPALVQDAQNRETTLGGAGGEITHTDALAIPSLVVNAGGRTVTLQDVRVTENDRNQHGLIGQDLLRSGRGYVLDFDAMRFELLG